MPDDPAYRIFSQLVTQVRDAKKLKRISDSQLAEMTGLEIEAIKRMDSARYDPSMSEIITITKALDLNLAKMIQDLEAENG